MSRIQFFCLSRFFCLFRIFCHVNQVVGTDTSCSFCDKSPRYSLKKGDRFVVLWYLRGGTWYKREWNQDQVQVRRNRYKLAKAGQDRYKIMTFRGTQLEDFKKNLKRKEIKSGPAKTGGRLHETKMVKKSGTIDGFAPA